MLRDIRLLLQVINDAFSCASACSDLPYLLRPNTNLLIPEIDDSIRSCLKENNSFLRYEDKPVNGLQRSNHCLSWELYEKHKQYRVGKMQNVLMLNQVMRIVTTGL